MRTSLCTTALLFVGVVPNLLSTPEPPPDSLQAFLEQHCTSCHNPEKLKGKINLMPISNHDPLMHRGPLAELLA
jgi:hypothetical protein